MQIPVVIWSRKSNDSLYIYIYIIIVYIYTEIANILTLHINYGGRSEDVKERQANTGLSTLIFIISKSEGSEHLHWRAQSTWQFLHHCIHVRLIIIWLYITIAYQSNINHQPILQKHLLVIYPKQPLKTHENHIQWPAHQQKTALASRFFGGQTLTFPGQYYLICDHILAIRWYEFLLNLSSIIWKKTVAHLGIRPTSTKAPRVTQELSPSCHIDSNLAEQPFFKNEYNMILVGGIPTPLKNMTSSNGMMTFPIYGKS